MKEEGKLVPVMKQRMGEDDVNESDGFIKVASIS